MFKHTASFGAMLIVAALIIPSASVAKTPGTGLVGYLLVGNYVIAIPDHLRHGDLIVITDAQGEPVFERRMTKSVHVDDLNLPQGQYQIFVERKGETLKSARIALAEPG